MIGRFFKFILLHFGYELRQIEYYKRLEDPFTVVQHLLKKNTNITIVDVGAFKGEISRKMYNLFNPNRLIALEASPYHIKDLQDRVSDIANISVFNFAVTDKIGVVQFNINESEETNSIFDFNQTELKIKEPLKTVESISVNTITLDELCVDRNIKKIDFIKLDIQGAELSALKGASQLLERGDISFILCEVEFMPIYKDQPLCHDIFSYLSNYNYSLFRFYNFHFSQSGQLLWADALFYAPNCANEVENLKIENIGLH